MIVHELSHLFFRHAEEIVLNQKDLGLFYSYEDVQRAIQYYCAQPGFSDNQDAFSVRERDVIGNIVENTVFEVIIYLHSEDYAFETEIELGLYGDKMTAQSKLIKYCKDNASLVTAQQLVCEKIVNKCIIGRKEWPEGFLL